jgi:monofunctional glycosyltransferase
VDDTAHLGEPAPAAPKEGPAAEADVPPPAAERLPPGPTPTAAEPVVAEAAPPPGDAPCDTADASPDPAPQPAEPVSERPVAPVPAETVAAAPEAPAEAGKADELKDLPTAPAPAADLVSVAASAADDRQPAGEAEVDAKETETNPILPAQPGPEAEAAHQTAAAVELPHYPPHEWEEARESEPAEGAGRGEQPAQPEALPAAVRAAPAPQLVSPGAEVPAPRIGRQEPENPPFGLTADASPPFIPAPASASSEPAESGGSAQAGPAPVALASIEEERRPEDSPEAAEPHPDVAAPAAVVVPSEVPRLSGDEPLIPEPKQAPVGSSEKQAPAVPPAASIQSPAWPLSDDTVQPTSQLAAVPELPALPGPARAPLPAVQKYAARPLPDLRRTLPYVGLALRAAAIATVGLVVTVLALAVVYRWVNPPISALMIGRSLAGTEIERSWVPLERISPHLMRAVILSEDGGFCRHSGVDWAAIEEAIETDRGGSTITMQVVKNLFLWPSRSYVRKAIEIGLAYLVEALWPKRRILEIYLNIAEWGDGVFGAEAAAETHFGKRAGRLTVEEAALLAAVLPNPIERTAGAPSEITGRLASRLATKMRTSRADFSCVPVPRLEPRAAPPRSPRPRSPNRAPERSLEKPPLVQGPRMTL